MHRQLLRIFAILILPACAGAAFAQARSGAWLMGVLRDQASQHAAQARAAHDEKDAATWQAWAGLYGKFSQDARIQQVDAVALSRNNAKFNQQEALVMVRNGIQPAADLYNASAQMWMDLAQQLETGSGTPRVRFPEAQMLRQIAGLAGTPWQDLGGQHAADCQVLAQRAQSCQSQLAQMRHHNLVTGQGDGFPEVMQLRQCDAAQELYLAQCQQ